MYQVQEVTPESVIQALSNELVHERHWLRRYRDALRRIADGRGDPQRIAWEALGDDSALLRSTMARTAEDDS